MELFCGERRIVLGTRLGAGGEGAVYEIVGQPDFAAKIYHKPDATRAAKIEAIIAAKLSDSCPAVAFPLGALRTPDGRFVGFVMRKVAGHQPIHELFGIGSMGKYFPQADAAFLVRVALNLARAAASLHAQQIVIGDINSSGILVGRDAGVILIDADSMQMGQFDCRVGMAEYTPPELQHASLGSVIRTVNHDCFGLAVMIFQLLALGRHPYAFTRKTGNMPLADAIAHDRFAYSLLRQTGLQPPPKALRLSDLPLAVRTLLERAFAPLAGSRPSAAQWITALTGMEQWLARCPAKQTHILYSPAAPCPWCRLERNRPAPIFRATRTAPSQASFAPTPALEQAKATIRFAKANAGETARPAIARRTPFPTAAACLAKRTDGRPRPISIAQLAAFGPNPARQLAARYVAARASTQRAIDDWHARAGIWTTYRMIADLEDRMREYGAITRHATWAQASETERALLSHAMQRVADWPLARATITGVSKGMVARLAQIGVASAADLVRIDVAGLKGIGKARAFALLLWRDSMLVQAEAQLRADPVQIAAIRSKGRLRLQQRITTLERAIDEQRIMLESHICTVRAAIRKGDAAIERAYAEIDQAICDLRHIGVDETCQPLTVP